MTEQADPPAPSPDALAALRERLVQSELRAAAREAGMHDLDGLRLLDQSALVLDDKMALPDIAGLIARLKRDKPYFFHQSSSTAAAAPPAAAPARGRNAMEMSMEEWRTARADLLRRR